MRATFSATTMTAWRRRCLGCGHAQPFEGGEPMSATTTPVLEGTRVRLEPMTLGHLAGLEAIVFDDRIWRYMPVRMKTPQDLRGWVEKALQLQEAGTTVPWVTVLKSEDRVIGSTRF